MLLSDISPASFMSDQQPIVNRILLGNGGMFDTLWTEEEFREAYNTEDNVLVTAPGVFGEVLICPVRVMTGFISRKDLDMQKALEAQQSIARAMGQMPNKSGLVVPRSGTPY